MARGRVVVFARNGGQILLDQVGEERVTPLSAPADRPVADTVRTTIEELFVADQHTVRCLSTQDAGASAVLVDVPKRQLRPDAPVAHPVWMHASELRSVEGDVWNAYRAVAPTVESVCGDRTHGSTTLSIEALEVLRDHAAAADRADTELRSTARQLATCRPDMIALGVRIDRTISQAGDRLEQLASICEDEIDRAVTVDRAAAKHAATLCPDEPILTLSRSETVEQTLQLAEPPRVIVLRADPGGEGVSFAESLAARGLDVAIAPDAAVGHILATESIGSVLVGADAIAPDSSMYNKLGTRTVATLASIHRVPTLVVTASDKVAPELPPPRDRIDPTEIHAHTNSLALECPLFDHTPADLLSAIITEDGIRSPEQIAAIADRHRALQAWRRG